AVLAATRYFRAGRTLLVASILMLAAAGLSPLGNALILPLEQRFPAWTAGGAPPDGIVVLGGSFDTVVSQARGEVALTDAAGGMTVVAGLAGAYPQARIVFSGGSGRLMVQGALEADLAKRLFHDFGIDDARIALDAQSRDTLENAVESKRIADPKPG